jgi:RHS repeat-associated protein
MRSSDHILVQFGRPNRGRRGARGCATGRIRSFRRACRSRFPSHLVAVQSPWNNPRTCFEGPFGEVIRATGPMARANPFRFSTKYQDDETDLLYYGFRYYTASSGRWLSRDPLGEAGGLALYSFVENDPANVVDVRGLWKKAAAASNGHVWEAEEGDTLAKLARLYGASPDDWPCLWPDAGTKDHGYPNNIHPCDKYDASNLAVPAPRSTTLHVGVAQDLALGAESVLGKLQLMHADMVASAIQSTSGEGGTPLQDFLIEGHGPGGSWNGKHYYFTEKDLLALDQPPSFSRASSKKGPVRCWFARNAVVRFVGCNTDDHNAKPFASKILRKGASAFGSNQMIGLGEGKMWWDFTPAKNKDGYTWASSSKDWLKAPVWVQFPGQL